MVPSASCYLDTGPFTDGFEALELGLNNPTRAQGRILAVPCLHSCGNEAVSGLRVHERSYARPVQAFGDVVGQGCRAVEKVENVELHVLKP